MDKKHRPSVKGLANIGALLNRGELPKLAEPASKRERRSQHDIHSRTIEKIKEAFRGADADVVFDLVSTYVRAACRDSYNNGHADALEQNSAVEKLLEQQYEARTKLTMPAVVAAVMEQQGLSSMTLDLAHMATVFKRNDISYTVTEQDVIEYIMRPIGE